MDQVLAQTLADGLRVRMDRTRVPAEGYGLHRTARIRALGIARLPDLAAQYESWLLPLAIVLIVPMCLLSALLGVYVVGSDNNVLTQIGFIVLVGLACKNAILIVEFARERMEQGMSAIDAAVEASRLRLRPILMTSIAFIMGVVPLAIASGAGTEMRMRWASPYSPGCSA